MWLSALEGFRKKHKILGKKGIETFKKIFMYLQILFFVRNFGYQIKHTYNIPMCSYI